MDLGKILSKENLKSKGKILAALTVGATVATISNKTGLSEFFIDNNPNNINFNTGFLGYFGVKANHFYDFAAGIVSAIGTYTKLDKY